MSQSTDARTDDRPALRPARREARVVAFVVDALVLAALLPLFLAFGGLTVLLQSDWLADDPSGGEWFWGYLVTGLWLLTPLAYFTIGAARTDTLGARLLRLTVRDATHARPSPGRALLRAALLLLGGLVLGLGFLAALVDRRGRTLGDRLTGTSVWEQRS